jgi:poly-gamma-glutamate capsule biosynthesis protein CapA/YwtB (metallophosphatase superfamily)
MLASRIQVALLAFCLSLSTAWASENSNFSKPVEIQLQVLSEDSLPIAGSILIANGKQATADKNGYLSARVEIARRYQLKVIAPGYYSMLHTFSEQERKSFQSHLPDIILVKQKPGRVMLAFTGDAMLGRRYHTPNPGDPRLISQTARLEDSKALLSAIKPYLDIADYTSVNLESPVVSAEPSQRSTKTVTFFSYPETLEALQWAGVDHVSLGNNHTFDYFNSALKETLERLATSGLGYSGAGLNELQALQPYQTQIHGEDYSFHGYVGWAGRVVPSQVAEGSDKGGAALGSKKNITTSVAAQSQRGVSVVEYHGSREYSFQPTDETRDRLRTAIDHGADLAIGHHPHVLHGFEVYQGKLIAYSLGNFLFDQYIYETQRAALLYVWMDGEEFHRAEAVPLYIKSYQPTPAMGKIRDYVLRRLGQQSSLEGVVVHLSGGHAVIAKSTPHISNHVSTQKITTVRGEQLIEPDNWREQFGVITFQKDDVAYRIGRDWWALGDHEQEQQFQLVDRSWKYPSPSSGINTEKALENYAMEVVIPKGTKQASVSQQYFMRVWDDKPKTIALNVFTEGDIEIRACLELRTLEQSIAQGRENPEIHCMDKVSVNQSQWQQLLFDFNPPKRELYRGMRFRFDVFSKTADNSSLYMDNLKFISWEKWGRSHKGQSVSLDDDKRWNVLGISSSTSGTECCQLSKSHLR